MMTALPDTLRSLWELSCWAVLSDERIPLRRDDAR